MAPHEHAGESKIATLAAIFRGLLPTAGRGPTATTSAKVTQLQHGSPSILPVARSGIEPLDRKAALSAKSSERTPLLLLTRKPAQHQIGSSDLVFGFSKPLLRGEAGYLFPLAAQMVRLTPFRLEPGVDWLSVLSEPLSRLSSDAASACSSCRM